MISLNIRILKIHSNINDKTWTKADELFSTGDKDDDDCIHDIASLKDNKNAVGDSLAV